MKFEIALVSKFLDLLKILWPRGKKPSDAIIDSINIRGVSEELINGSLNVDCFFIVMVHNSGGRLRPDNFMYWSIIDGNFSDEKMPGFRYKSYQLVNTDIDFLQLARRVYEKKEISVRVDEMIHGNLRTSFEYERLKYLRCFYLKQDKRAMWFIMAGTTAPNEHLEQIEQKGKIIIAVNQIKNIIREY